MALLVENVDYKLDHLSDNLYQFYFKQDGIFTPTGLKLKLVEGKDKYKNIFFRSALLDGRYHFQKEITLEPISTDTTIIKLNDSAFTSLQNIDYELYHSGSRAMHKTR